MKRSRKYGCLLLSLALLLSLLPRPAGAEGTGKTVRVGWYEDSYHITGPNGERSGYGYEYEQALAAYTGWNYEYVRGDWGELLEMLQKGEIDLMGAISYTEDRAKTMLFSDAPMGEERYYLYVDLTDPSVSVTDLSTLEGKRIVVMEKSVQAAYFSQWEQTHGVQTQHVNIDNIQRAKELAGKGEIDGVVSTETPIWVDCGMSAIANVGGSGIYYAISKDRPDLKQELDNAMRAMEYDKPFYGDELYKRYLAAVSTPVLSGEEQQWLAQHGPIRIGWLMQDAGFSDYDPDSGKFSGILADYVILASNCLGENTLSFDMTGFDSTEEELQALKGGAIDLIFHFTLNPYVGEENGLSLSNTVMSLNMVAVTAQSYFNESEAHTVAVAKDDLLRQWYVSYNYPNWTVLLQDTAAQAESAVRAGTADCFLAESGQLTGYDKDPRLHTVFLMQPGNVCFAVRRGDTALLSILNKTLRTIPASLLGGALSMYETAPRKVTLGDYIRENLVAFSVTTVSLFALILLVILWLLGRARRAAAQAQALNWKLRESQKNLESAMERAEEANAAKTTFLFNMSHDIRTPMNAILGFTALAEKDPGSSREVKDYLRKIRMSGEGMLSILDNVLELSRIESGKTTLEETPQAAGTIFDACLVMMHPEIEKHRHTVTAEKHITQPYVFFDAPRITEIILNILSNAVKYTADGGTIRCVLTQSPCARPGWICQELTVADNGIGMSEEFQKHVFESFVRERSTTLSGIQGTGLGMGIVKKLVDLMDGTIELTSKLGEGTTVTVKIPMRIATYEQTQPRHATASAGKGTLKGKRVLLAEDNDLNAEIASVLLEEEGILVDRAADGVQCVEKVERSQAGTYDLILMDIQMPNLDGYRATEKIRHLQDPAKAHIPIIAMTANAFSEDKAKALEVGMNDHVAKPIDMDVLVETLTKYL